MGIAERRGENKPVAAVEQVRGAGPAAEARRRRPLRQAADSRPAAQRRATTRRPSTLRRCGPSGCAHRSCGSTWRRRRTRPGAAAPPGAGRWSRARSVATATRAAGVAHGRTDVAVGGVGHMRGFELPGWPRGDGAVVDPVQGLRRDVPGVRHPPGPAHLVPRVLTGRRCVARRRLRVPHGCDVRSDGVAHATGRAPVDQNWSCSPCSDGRRSLTVS